MIGFKAIEFALPPNLVPVSELDEVKRLDAQKRKVFDLTLAGMQTVAIDESRGAVELAVEASKLALDSSSLLPTDIDVLISIQSRAPTYLMASEATHIQDLLGLKKAVAFSVGDLGCANISNAVMVARTMINGSSSINNVLICSGSKPFGVVRYREAVTVNGDAGMGVVVSRDCEDHVIRDVELMTDGKYWDLFRVEYKNKRIEEMVESCTSERYKFELAIASRNNFNAINRRLLERNTDVRVKAHVMQNLSIEAFRYNEEALDVRFIGSCRDNCARYGHLGSIDVLLNYKTGLARGEIASGDTVLIQNNSPAACWSSMLVSV
ncbi:MAG: hypothetical protein ACAI38_18000 [Myxococcota bacterium]|nr:hypothetical protein [Myxococcota bacterium]